MKSIPQQCINLYARSEPGGESLYRNFFHSPIPVDANGMLVFNQKREKVSRKKKVNQAL